MIKKLIIITFVSIMIVVAGCSAESENNGNQNLDNEEIQRNENNQRDETQEQIDEGFKELSSTGQYTSPGGNIVTEVSIEVDENNIIKNVAVSTPTNDKTSQNYVEKYNEGIREELIGVSLSEAQSPEKVNGSSLTSKGFNEALNNIKSQ